MDSDNRNLIETIANEVISQLKAKGINGKLPNTGSCIASGGSVDAKVSELNQLARMIDHTLLKPEASYDQVRQLCDEAVEFGFASVCVNSANVALAVECLRGTNIPVCSVVGFPLGATTTKTKVFETKEAIENGASEIDMVINVGALKSRDYNRVKSDIEEVVIAARGKAIVKVIIETCLLTDEEKTRACEISKDAGADFVKTSTGFGSGGATVEDIRLMRRVVGPNIGVKASGGVSDYKTATAMLDAGACSLGDSRLCRLGTSKSIKIISG